MKNQNTKSMTTHVKRKLVLATCLILAALGPPAAELSRGASLNGSPPGPANQTFTISGICAFDVQVTVNGNQILMLTGRNGFFDPSVGILLLVGNFTAVFDSNGNIIQEPTGTGQATQVCDLI